MSQLSDEQIQKFDRVIRQIDHILKEEEITQGEYAVIISAYASKLDMEPLCYLFKYIADNIIERDEQKVIEILNGFIKRKNNNG